MCMYINTFVYICLKGNFKNKKKQEKLFKNIESGKREMKKNDEKPPYLE